MPASIDIVQIREEHIEGFHAAVDRVSRERKYLSFLEAPPIEQTRTFVRNVIAKGHPQRVALDGPKVVGWCDINPSDRPAMKHGGTLGMGLIPEWRGRGLGARLMRATLDAAPAAGISRVALTVREDNERAFRLYRSMGFKVEGRFERAMCIDGAYHDLIAMALLFDAAPAMSDPAGANST